jgi:hypothetical protein
MDAALNVSHQRAVDDLLQAERDLRNKGEDTTRAMRQVLMETANRFDGTRMQALQRSDPSIPARWGTLEWKKFFDDVPVPSQGWVNNITVAPDMRALRKLQKQITELQAALAQAELELEDERAKKSIVISSAAVEGATQPVCGNQTAADAIADIPSSVTPALTIIVEDTKKMHDKFPEKIPAAFTNMLSGGERSGGDLARVFQRYWLILYLIGHWRLTAAMELEEVLAETVGVSAGSGSMERVLEDMEKANILLIGKLELKLPRTVLKLYRFSVEGEKLYQSLFAARPYENDWSRLIRLQEGERFPEQTLAVLAFTMHARKRGWATQILPELKGAKSLPDALLMLGDEKLYVEVELGEKESVARLRNQSALNGGRTAVCTATEKSRAQLVGDCKLDKLPGMATDLESLIMGKFKKINSASPLWLENWK